MTVGPNAVLALAREGYDWSMFSLRDMVDMGRFPGFRRVIARHGRSGLAEFTNSVSKRGYLALCRQYCPDLTLDELQSHPQGFVPKPS